jgi:hypothetical protein
MPMGEKRLKYGPVAMAFHGTIALLIIANFVIAWIMNGHALVWDWGEMHGPLRLELVQYHKSITPQTCRPNTEKRGEAEIIAQPASGMPIMNT